MLLNRNSLYTLNEPTYFRKRQFIHDLEAVFMNICYLAHEHMFFRGGNICYLAHEHMFVSSKQSFSRLGKVQTLRDLPSVLGLSKTFLFMPFVQKVSS